MVSQGRAVLVTDAAGEIAESPELGFFVHQTRMLSRYAFRIDGKPWQPAGFSNVQQHSSLGYYIAWPPDCRPERGEARDATARTIELRSSRYLGGGCHEDLDVTNYARVPTRFVLGIEVAADFADQQETEAKRRHKGRTRRAWRQARPGFWQLEFRHVAAHRSARLVRGLLLRIGPATSPPRHVRGRIEFEIALLPGESWHACLDLIPHVAGRWLHPAHSCYEFGRTLHEEDVRRDTFLAEAARFAFPETGSLAPTVAAALERARFDLAALRLCDLDVGERAWTMAAGLPHYVALFGRDTLTAAWQAALLGPEMLRGTLPAIARLKGTRDDPWRDEQPGKLLHEAQTGPLAALGYTPRDRYYGAQTTSAFFGVALAELWHWTGDSALVRELLPAALGALRWLDAHGDLDGDGFYEYLTRSPQGNEHQGWKDSRDAIVDEDGAPVRPPIATCEEQGFVYAAKFMLAEVLWSLGDRAEAEKLFREAAELKKHFNDAFWDDDLGFFALGLDARKRRIRSVASNPGHCLATGIVDRDLILRAAGRLVDRDLFSGWGIRTLSSRHPAYDPYSYHRGSIWPVENGTFALAFMRYGLFDHVDLVARAVRSRGPVRRRTIARMLRRPPARPEARLPGALPAGQLAPGVVVLGARVRAPGGAGPVSVRATIGTAGRSAPTAVAPGDLAMQPARGPSGRLPALPQAPGRADGRLARGARGKDPAHQAAEPLVAHRACHGHQAARLARGMAAGGEVTMRGERFFPPERRAPGVRRVVRARAAVAIARTAERHRTQESLTALVREAIDHFGGMGTFVRPGQTVLIKPNQTGPMLADEGITTDPRVVVALLNLCREAGAARVLVGESSGMDRTWLVMQATGMSSAVRAAGGEIVFFDECRYREVAIPGGRALRRIRLPEPLLAADVIVNACKAKTHHMDPISGAIKNWVGVIGLEEGRQEHHDALAFQEWVDVMSVSRPALNVCDALVVGEGDGPLANTPRWCGCVLAATDPVAMDVTICRLLGLDPATLRFAAEGAAIGLGTADPDAIGILGVPLEAARVEARRPRQGWDYFPFNVIVGGGVTYAGTLGHWKSVADLFLRDGTWVKAMALRGVPTFLIGDADDPDFERHVREGPYFVIDDAAPARYRLDPRVHYLRGHPVLHTMLPELLRGLGLTVPGNLSNRAQQLVRAGEARLYYVPWWQTALETGAALALLAGTALAGLWLRLRRRRQGSTAP